MFICLEGCKCSLPKLLAMKLALLDFEARKDAAQARAAYASDIVGLSLSNSLAAVALQGCI